MRSSFTDRAENRIVDVVPLYMGVEGFEKALVRIEGTKEYLNEQLVAYGLAWVKPGECSTHLCAQWKKLQKLARGRGIGLWADRRPIPPWEWKRVQWGEIVDSKNKKPVTPKSP